MTQSAQINLEENISALYAHAVNGAAYFAQENQLVAACACYSLLGRIIFWIINLFTCGAEQQKVHEVVLQTLKALREGYQPVEPDQQEKVMQLVETLPGSYLNAYSDIQQEVEAIRYQILGTHPKAMSPQRLLPARSASLLINGEPYLHYLEANQRTLWEFHEMPPEERQNAILHFELQAAIGQINREMNFIERLNQADRAILESLTFIDLVADTTAVKYGLISEEECRSLTIEDLQDVGDRDIEILFQRLHHIDREELEPITEIHQFEKLTILEFLALTPQQINAHLQEFPNQLMFILSDQQIQGLDFVNLTMGQVQQLFPNNSDWDEANRSRFDLLESNQIQLILGHLTTMQIKLIPDEKLQGFDFAKLSRYQLSRIFPTKQDEQEESQRRFSLLSAEQVQSMLNHLSKDQFGFITDEQIQGLDVATLTRLELIELFPSGAGNEQENRRRFALLQPGQIGLILGKLSDEMLNYLSNTQFRALDFSTIIKVQVNRLFPQWSEQANRPRQVESRTVGTEQVQLRVQRIKAENVAKFTVLTAEQRVQLKDKLSLGNANLLDQLNNIII